jgi:hypothetical protein
MPVPVASVWTSLAGLCGPMNAQAVLSVGSACVTGYFWLVKMGRERAGLRLYRVGDFRADRLQGSTTPGKATATWHGGLCLANPATVPAVVVRLQVHLNWGGQWLEGRLVLESKDGPPWTVEPMRVFSRTLGVAFPVEENTDRDRMLRPQRFRFTFAMADGRTRTQELSSGQ